MFVNIFVFSVLHLNNIFFTPTQPQPKPFEAANRRLGASLGVSFSSAASRNGSIVPAAVWWFQRAQLLRVRLANA